MRALLLILWISVLNTLAEAQVATTSFYVNGDKDKFYPVIFQDNNWGNSVATVIEIGRSDTHYDEWWRGSMIARFRIHNMLWGHGSHFIETDIYQGRHGYAEIVPFIGGYHDATLASGNREFIIWLKGASTYFYVSNAAQSPRIYDNVQNMLPYQQENGAAHTFKTRVEDYVNSRGSNTDGVIHVMGQATNYFAGNIGIGKRDATEKLEVNGNIRAKEIKVETANWPDYVFEEDYKLTPLAEVETFIKANKHLPEVPSAREIEEDGLSLGEMNKLMMKKIEELTLHLIEKEKRHEILSQRVHMLIEKVDQQASEINQLKNK
ncbi:hypothetical protein U0038_06455 [Sphingobacterium spiritivorum]|uniref:Uncharacterized protein n=1 Tax=Sphingobacterium spiritivorum ATCC 33861 TaxID=525373 RepID=D7VJW6_SPHSI|nr:hypothetical protein [Sphingobacterium spiritivorum]EFK58568.1 hypothetical protein HMPREF0766_11285 [Sphingobacterium spiritivorum ATCC 33861]WQD35385.1 hypothetical protein U0038_06455 [Sphingobacterium spiritivorum]SUJ00292.1 Uncharacterised protein [Sphingobacterium spiritivorum]